MNLIWAVVDKGNLPDVSGRYLVKKKPDSKPYVAVFKSDDQEFIDFWKTRVFCWHPIIEDLYDK